MDVIFWNSVSGTPGETLPVITRYVGPYKIKHWIKKSGYQSQVIDHVHYLTEEQLYTATKKFITGNTLVIALSTTFTTDTPLKRSDGTYSPFPENVANVAIRLRKEFPYIKFVLGGYGAEHVYGGKTWDVAIMSYKEASEDIFVEYLNYLKFNSEPPISKLITKYFHLDADYVANNKIYHRPYYYEARQKIYNIELDDFKFTKEDAILPGEALPLDISRGCIFACRFCNYPHLGKSKTDYIRGMDYVREELIQNYELFGTTNYLVLDDTFNETSAKMEAFLAMTKTLPFEINYSAYLRADLIHRFPDTAYMLKESGLFGAFHGIESMHPSASKLVGKGWSGTPQAKEFIPKLYHDLWQGQVPMLLNYIVGWPEETLDDVMSTLHWFKDNNLYSIAYEQLGLSDPKKSHRFSIMNEFEKNSEQYGFEFLDTGERHVRNAWKNKTWDPESVTSAKRDIYKFIIENKLRKVSVWNLGSMRFLGYDKEYLLTTAKEDYDLVDFNNRSSNVYQKYYDLLMSL